MKYKKPIIKIVFIIIVIFVIYEVYTSYDRVFARDAYLYSDISRVNSKVSGQVLKINISDGELVKKGDILFELDCKDQILKRNTIKASINFQENYKKSLFSTLKLAEQNYKNAKASLELSDQDILRYERLHHEKAISDIEYAAKQHALINQQSNLIKAKQTVQSVTSNLINTNDQIKILETQEKDIQNQVNECKVQAKITGKITNFRLAKGDYVTKGKSLFSIIDNQDWKVIANVKESYLSSVKVGQKVRITTSLTGLHFLTGTVIHKDIAINKPEYSKNNALPDIDPNVDWIKLDKRFPVIIRVDKTDLSNDFSVGADAHVWFI
ncbi:efflux RND transporter periplasmic adaptor subunit [Francisella sp. 19X1-34]|uniref:HlyD family secretion protein n=1 Tax=Francisella sp. 19X1-34 TaxID=3087177 RepID=UPI002E2F97ED|nr:efflux RND transporter periplasmic adaptor subunit [Francisella sp. 19X1-34]MED7788074.1 efflux RND transporter periplasmic adaptor subunit [Francisella sp. 19X1-34]